MRIPTTTPIGRPPKAAAERKDVVVTIRMTAGQARELAERARIEGYDPAALRTFVIASMVLGITHTPEGKYAARIKAIPGWSE